MEALVGLATVVQLVDATAKVAKTASALCQHIHDTPMELQNLINHLDRIHRLLQQISMAEVSSKTQFSSTGLSPLRELLVSIEVTVLDLQQRYVKYKGRPGIGRRLKLALLESKAIEKYSNRIQALEIEFVLQFLCR